MREAIEFIVINWKEGKSLKEVARMFDVDPGNLDRAFRQAHQSTVKIFTDQKRKALVEAMVQHDKRFGYEIGMELGFRSDRAFYRWVRRAYGVSYRKLHAHGITKPPEP